MSIIYDALKKIEKSNILRGGVDKKGKESKTRLKVYLLYFLVACSGLFIGNIFFNFLSAPKDILTRLARPSVKEALPQPRDEIPLETAPTASVGPAKKLRELLVLNGIFSSQDEGYALINNQIVKEGDLIEGATVKRIGLNEVELEFQGSTIKLSTNQ